MWRLYERSLLFDTREREDVLVREVAEALDAVAPRMGTSVELESTEEFEDDTFVAQFAVSIGAAEVRLTLDRQIRSSYAVVRGEDALAVDEIADALRSRLPTISRDALWAAAAAASDDELGPALMRLSIATGPNWQPDDVDLVRRGLRSPDPAVRADTATAVGTNPSPLFAEDVRAAARSETDGEAGRVLRYVSDFLDGRTGDR